MAGRTKKRPRMPSAETSDSGEELIDIEEIDEDDFPPITKEQQALDEQELEKAHDVYTAQQSQCYAAYNPPYISEQRGKNKHRMCERPIHRPIYDTSPTNLSKHVVSCLKKQKDVEDSQKLAALGVSGTGDIDPRDVPQLCAIWCAEGAPLGEAGHIGIMHPTVVRNVPSRKVVSSEIGRLYTAVQESLIESLHLDIEDVEELSNEEEDDVYTSESCRRTLAKFRAIACKLNKSPNSKTLFVDICQGRGCAKPHSIGRDGTPLCFNSRDRRLGTLRQYHITDADITLANDLAEILQPFYEITLQVLIKGSARLADVVVFIDQITSHLSSAISNEQHAYPPALRNACRGGLQLTNKYYSLTDCSPLYRVAMVLHPSFKDEYFKLAKWDQEWIDEAIRLTREMWETNYKPSAQPPPSKEANPHPKPQTGVLAQLSGASEARAGNNSTDPLNMWLAGGLHLNEEGLPVNPLKWWIQQARGGNTHGGLLHMALDVLSCPATTVDVERAFSFGRDYVSFKRHRLSASSVTRGMSIAFYSKSGEIKPGTLRKWKENQKNEQKKTKGKSRDK
ncbi:hypothetical protein PSTG_15404 [Puccinia striiformis f. sp. tritici PST-78]|uniref:HAT C-terminal dimerisation domain-containing protein n=1 Tax=Puccinia striiformis f. sp. tritici PST-78 TaxID=1165861 RepID=A0A0L0UWN6_9BASI|nr:hypothetical protein PSTG_15404 [Puccinia striiformis f. sp. tritici PST-78]